MIIWLNGAFGSGKTQTAYELKRRIENSHVFDPEEIGFFIGRRVPGDLELADFQDYSIWREMTGSFLDYIDRDGKLIIVPMTVVKEEYLKEILGKLGDNHTVKHFSLMARKETIEKRLLRRGDRRRDWTFGQIDRCLSALEKDFFREHVDTEKVDIGAVAEFIAGRSGLKLEEDRAKGYRKKLYRLKVQLRHIRFAI